MQLISKTCALVCWFDCSLHFVEHKFSETEQAMSSQYEVSFAIILDKNVFLKKRLRGVFQFVVLRTEMLSGPGGTVHLLQGMPGLI